MTQSSLLRAALREMILESQERAPQETTPRSVRLEALPGKASVCVGVRRCGKSTLLLQRAQALRAEGVARERIVYLNLFDDRLHGLTAAHLGLIVEECYALYPEGRSALMYFFLDELQVVAGWEPFVDRLLRVERAEVYISGSSAQMLSTEIATQMRGRSLSWELFPFSFTEYLDHTSVPRTLPLSPQRRAHIRAGFELYWREGGFPEVSGVSAELRVRVHQEYLSAALFRDIIERHDVAHPRAVSDLARRLLSGVGSLYTLNKLTSYLHGLGHKMSKVAIADCLRWFEDAFMLFTVLKHDASLSKANANPKKIYCVDHALVCSVSLGVLANTGHLLENLVFIALRRRTQQVSYYKTEEGWEVDFIARTPSGERLLVQVCERLGEGETRQRELRALRSAMREQGLARGLVVTREEEEALEGEEGRVDVVPVWRFLLEWEA